MKAYTALAMPSLLALATLGCTTSPPTTTAAQSSDDCITREPPIGSNVPRAVRCPGTSTAAGLERDAQRDQAERIRDDQNRRNLPRPAVTKTGS